MVKEMKKYLFVSDLDGTLLNKKHQLSKKTIKYINKLTKQGHYFAINTGRPYQGMLKFKEQLNIDCPYICDNGGSIYWDSNPDFPIFTGIDVNIVKNLYKELLPYIYGAMFASHQKLVFHNRKNVQDFIIHINEETKVFLDNVIENLDTPITLISLYIHDENRNEVMEIINKYQNSIAVRAWGTHNGIKSFELFSVNSSKGKALKLLKNYLGVDETMAFGDDLNDIDMLNAADIGVAMVNARTSLKTNVNFLTFKNNHNHGVIHFIKKYLRKNSK